MAHIEFTTSPPQNKQIDLNIEKQSSKIIFPDEYREVWMQFKFKNIYIYPQCFAIKSGSGDNNLDEVKIEGSNDGKNWVLLYKNQNENHPNFTIYMLSIEYEFCEAFSYLRLSVRTPSGNYAISGIEIYGYILNRDPNDPPYNPSLNELKPVQVGPQINKNIGVFI